MVLSGMPNVLLRVTRNVTMREPTRKLRISIDPLGRPSASVNSSRIMRVNSASPFASATSQCEPLSVNWWSEMYTRIPFGKYSAEADSDAVPVRVRVASCDALLVNADVRVGVGGGVTVGVSVCVALSVRVPASVGVAPVRDRVHAADADTDSVWRGVGVGGGVMVAVTDDDTCDDALPDTRSEAERLRLSACDRLLVVLPVGVGVGGGVTVSVTEADTDSDRDPDAVGDGVGGGVTVTVSEGLTDGESDVLGDCEALPVADGDGVSDRETCSVAEGVARSDSDGVRSCVRVGGRVCVRVASALAVGRTLWLHEALLEREAVVVTLADCDGEPVVESDPFVMLTTSDVECDRLRLSESVELKLSVAVVCLVSEWEAGILNVTDNRRESEWDSVAFGGGVMVRVLEGDSVGSTLRVSLCSFDGDCETDADEEGVNETDTVDEREKE